ncbi:MAG TPA: Uma2 family endonuclease [Bryobacteraceae bacterium]|jgi:Uma2 family endonuclease|nr:Uma2 family endonuclease [Bryobacteraceae bacterium]
MATTPKVITYEEWLKLPEAEGVEEVVQGEIRKMPPNKILHADTVENLTDILKAQLDRKTVQVRVSTFGLVIRRDPLTTRVPDIAVFVRKNVVEQDGYIHSAPELVVEVLSPANTRAERTEKLKDYESLGVPEVWVVSPEAQTVEVLLLIEGRLSTAALLREGQLKPAHFPGAAVDIASIWPK